jgi:hypothetical protein
LTGEDRQRWVVDMGMGRCRWWSSGRVTFV